MKLTKKQEQRIEELYPLDYEKNTPIENAIVVARQHAYKQALKDIQPLVEALKYYKTLFPTTNIAEFNYGEIATKALQDFLGESD